MASLSSEVSYYVDGLPHNLTAALTVEVYNGEVNQGAKLGDASAVINPATGVYRATYEHTFDGDPFDLYFKWITADEQVAAQEFYTKWDKCDYSIAEILSYVSSMAADVWAAITTAAKNAIASAVWLFTGGRTVTNTGLITVVSPVDVDTERAKVRRGFDYYVTDNNYLGWSSSDWPDLTGASAILEHEILGDVALEIVNAGESVQTVRVAALTATQTNSLKLGFSDVQLKATLANHHLHDLGSTEIQAVD